MGGGGAASRLLPVAGGEEEVNWKKLRCGRRGAEARGNKLDISPAHVGWLVYTVHAHHLLTG